MQYEAHPKQEQFHLSQKRVRGAFAGKRGGKTEAGAIEALLYAERKPGFVNNGVDPYIGVVIAPTTDMLRRLSLQKLLAYAKPPGLVKNVHQTHNEITWHNGTVIYGISADKPARLEGIKASFIWMDEVFQMKEQIFTEAMARVSDTQGHIWCTGSLGTQYTNPKAHWVYKHFKDKPDDQTECFEWTTKDNPYYPREEIERLRNTLDPKTFRQMFTIDWSVQANAVVYEDFDEGNVMRGYVYDPKLPTFVSIDWGWSHPMACLFFQYDPTKDTVYLFDEIVQSRLKREKLWDLIKAKGYKITDWYCDIAGLQERESSDANIDWFKKTHGISFIYRKTGVQYGISVVRSYIKNGLGQRKFYIDEVKCPKSLDTVLNYSYPEKDGMILNENPVKVDDDAADAIRYFFVNKLDKRLAENSFGSFNRWKL